VDSNPASQSNDGTIFQANCMKLKTPHDEIQFKIPCGAVIAKINGNLPS